MRILYHYEAEWRYPVLRKNISLFAYQGFSSIETGHLIVSLLKRWILETLQGNAGADHVQDYLNEFAFQFNRRSSGSRGLLFHRLAQMAVVTAPNTRAGVPWAAAPPAILQKNTRSRV